MTDDSHIYAKHIEQSININIRTNALHQLKSMYRYELKCNATNNYLYIHYLHNTY